MPYRRIELCGDAPRAPMRPCKRRAWLPTGSPPAQRRHLPEQAKSVKSQGVRGTESPDSLNNTLKKTENQVSVFSGEVHLGVKQLNCLVGIQPADTTFEQAREAVVVNLTFAAQTLGNAG